MENDKTMTVTRALATLKRLDKKINKAINRGCFINHKVGQKLNKDCNPKADYQSIQDLIQRRNKIKSAVMKSNAITEVKIAGKIFTVQEAIDAKNSIGYKEQLLKELRTQNQETRYLVDGINDEVQQRLDRLLESSVGKEKTSSKELEAISKPFLERNQAVVVDDIQIEETIKNIETEIDDFLSEVDLSLNEINSQTTIEI